MSRTHHLGSLGTVGSLAAALALVLACGSEGTPIDGADASTGSGSGSGSGSDDGGSGGDAASGDAGGSALAACTRTPSLDADCAAKFPGAAPNGYVCPADPFGPSPPCKALETRGCTEVCTNRCCP